MQEKSLSSLLQLKERTLQMLWGFQEGRGWAMMVEKHLSQVRLFSWWSCTSSLLSQLASLFQSVFCSSLSLPFAEVQSSREHGWHRAFFIFHILCTMSTVVCMWLWSQVSALDLLVTSGPVRPRNGVGLKCIWWGSVWIPFGSDVAIQPLHFHTGKMG